MCSGCEFEREKGDDSSARWIGTSGWAREVVLVSMFGDGGVSLDGMTRLGTPQSDEWMESLRSAWCWIESAES